MTTQTRRRRFNVDEYYAMAEAGILTPDDRVELLDGEIFTMAPIGSRHASCVARLTRMLTARVGSHALVWVQNPTHLDDSTEPQPDVMLLEERDDFYASNHPSPEDVLLLIEVADTSVAVDRGHKLPLYALSGIREVWIVNLPEQCVEVYTEPSGEGYEASRVVGMGGEVSPEAFGDASLPVELIIPG